MLSIVCRRPLGRIYLVGRAQPVYNDIKSLPLNGKGDTHPTFRIKGHIYGSQWLRRRGHSPPGRRPPSPSHGQVIERRASLMKIQYLDNIVTVAAYCYSRHRNCVVFFASVSNTSQER